MVGVSVTVEMGVWIGDLVGADAVKADSTAGAEGVDAGGDVFTCPQPAAKENINRMQIPLETVESFMLSL